MADDLDQAFPRFNKRRHDAIDLACCSERRQTLHVILVKVTDEVNIDVRAASRHRESPASLMHLPIDQAFRAVGAAVVRPSELLSPSVDSTDVQSSMAGGELRLLYTETQVIA